VSFRNIEKKDLEGCAELYADVFPSAPWSEPWTAQAAIESLVHFYESKGFVGVLAEADGVFGFALGNIEPFHTKDLFYLREMCIARKSQFQGIGGQVYKALESELHERKVEQVYLATDRDIPAARFYLSNGFKCAKEMEFYTKNVNS